MIGRFINSDEYISTGQGAMGYNMYAYCMNNPVVRKDEDGTLSCGCIYDGHLLRYDDIGNIHYGYVGRVLFEEKTLLQVWGLVQIFAGTSEWKYYFSNFDDPRDQEMIRFGSQLWDLRMGDKNE